MHEYAIYRWCHSAASAEYTIPCFWWHRLSASASVDAHQRCWCGSLLNEHSLTYRKIRVVGVICCWWSGARIPTQLLASQYNIVASDALWVTEKRRSSIIIIRSIARRTFYVMRRIRSEKKKKQSEQQRKLRLTLSTSLWHFIER